jgi:hypothetical protein
MLVKYLSYSFVLCRVSQLTAQLIGDPPPVVHMYLYRRSDPDLNDASAWCLSLVPHQTKAESATALPQTHTGRLLHQGKMGQH